jgi:hypothetical protein
MGSLAPVILEGGAADLELAAPHPPVTNSPMINS